MLTGVLRQRPLVAEHLHPVDEVADAVGLGADQPRQRPVLVAEARLQQLRRAADAGQRVLDLVREHRRHAGDRAGGGAMGQLALDHLRHRALLQHDQHEPGLSGSGPP